MATRTYDEADLQSLTRWLEGNQDSRSEGMIPELQEVIAETYPARRILATNSAMGAIHIALQTIGVGAGDEVIVDPIVVFGGMAAMYQNAIPVWADVDGETYNMDPASVAERIGPRTKAIIVTHHFGSVAEIERILEIAAEHDVAVIEDCAHALFATQNDRYAGLFAHFSAFSFNHRKQLSTGQGGFLVINAEEYVELSLDKGFGRVPARLNWNYAMSGAVAALALSQWPRAREYVRRDHDLALLYGQAVDGFEWLRPQRIPAENWTAYHIWAATWLGDKHGIDKQQFMKLLRANGADYFLPSFMPYGAFGLDPSPAYLYPLFAESRYVGDEQRRRFPRGLCPTAEYLVPRMFNTVLSPVEDERVERYASGLAKTIAALS